MGLQKYRADKAGEIQPNGAQPYYTQWMGGPSLALIRNCPVAGATPRTVYIRGEADTFYSVPAAARIDGRDVKGFITCDENGYSFWRNKA